jgi:methylisocitrate lyase
MTSPLQGAIASSRPLIAPSVYDGISARVAQELGFQALYIGSYATGATRYGVPDIGYLGVEDMADQVRRISALVQIPIIVDGEGGFGNPIHVARSVRILERAGAAATHIEDHDFGKHITPSPLVLPLGKAVDKIKAALDARDSPDFLIIGRTDSTGSLGKDEALARAVAFQEAGADGVFMAGYGYGDDAAWDAARAALHVPIVNVDMPGQSAAQAAELGVGVVLYYALTHAAALKGIREALGELARSGTATGLEGTLPGGQEFDAFLGIERARADAQRYGLLG